MTNILLIIGVLYSIKWAFFDNEKTISEKIKRKYPEISEAELEWRVKEEFEGRIKVTALVIVVSLLLAIFG